MPSAPGKIVFCQYYCICSIKSSLSLTGKRVAGEEAS